MVARFMVATYEDGQVWSGSLSAVVLVEVSNLSEFDWNRHAGQVIGIAYSLQ